VSLSIGRSNKIMGWEGVGNRQLLKCKLTVDSMLTANLKFINKKSFCYSSLSLDCCFTLKIESACSVMCQTAGNLNFTLFQMVYFSRRPLRPGFHLNA
jgi:hypothetical protein